MQTLEQWQEQITQTYENFKKIYINYLDEADPNWRDYIEVSEDSQEELNIVSRENFQTTAYQVGYHVTSSLSNPLNQDEISNLVERTEKATIFKTSMTMANLRWSDLVRTRTIALTLGTHNEKTMEQAYNLLLKQEQDLILDQDFMDILNQAMG